MKTILTSKTFVNRSGLIFELFPINEYITLELYVGVALEEKPGTSAEKLTFYGL